MTRLTTKSTLKYVLLPGILPRIRDLFSSGFRSVAYFIASIFCAVRLLPPDHAYLNPGNAGRFGVRHVIGQAWGNLTFSRRNIDQVIIFFIMVIGIVLLFMQFFLLFLAFFAGTAVAADLGQTLTNYFTIDDPTYDLAFIFLDRVFGISGLFGSCVDQNVPCRLGFDAAGDPAAYGPAENIPRPFQTAMHGLFSFYNTGLLAIALIVFLYYVFTVVGETAISGTPFGRRFNHFWAPVRVLVAALLLLPMPSGFNGAQILTLNVAKWGSNMATNAWALFIAESERPVRSGDPTLLVARPEAPLVNTIVEGIWLGRMCQIADYLMYQGMQGDYRAAMRDIVRNGQAGGLNPALTHPRARAYIVRSDPSSLTGTSRVLLQQTNYAEAVEFALSPGAGVGNNELQPSVIRIVFGEAKDGDEYARYPGNVRPICGQADLRLSGNNEAGAVQAERGYYTLLQLLWFDPAFTEDGLSLLANVLPTPERTQDAATDFNLQVIECDQAYFNALVAGINPEAADACTPDPPPGFAVGPFNPVDDFQWDSNNGGLAFDYDSSLPIPFPISQQAVARQISADTFGFHFGAYGWAGAGIWYNRIAEVNGSLVSAIFNTPVHVKYPEVMERTYEQRRAVDDNVKADERFDQVFSDGSSAKFARQEEEYIAMAMDYARSHWQNAYEESEGGMFATSIKALFGLDGLFNIQDQEQSIFIDVNGDGQAEEVTYQVHPLAQLSMIGRSLIESAVMNFTISAFSGVMGGIIKQGGDFMGLGSAGKAASSFFASVAKIGLSIGFILFYIIPFLPFIYFFFAVGGWVKGLFEAMIGLPLWALSHITIDGEGLPGPNSMNGYFLILEIFIRPVLIVFGFLCSVVMFSSLIDILNVLWDDTVIPNVAGNNIEEAAGFWDTLGDAADTLFYTVMYAIIVYMVGMSAFKLTDLIPNQILRWIGASVSTFAEQAKDPAENLVSYAFFGSQSFLARGEGLMGGLFGRNA